MNKSSAEPIGSIFLTADGWDSIGGDRRGLAPRPYLSPTGIVFVRVPDYASNWVAFIGTYDDKRRERYRGTAFFVEVPYKNRGGYHHYLVTAKHCAEVVAGVCAGVGPGEGVIVPVVGDALRRTGIKREVIGKPGVRHAV